MLEIAQALQMAKEAGNGPKRSVLCLLVTGEEKGLLGSQYYAENPVFPIENTVANVNIDMVGRTDKKYADTPNYIYVIGSDRLSSELHQINEIVLNDRDDFKTTAVIRFAVNHHFPTRNHRDKHRCDC